ncbi:putative Beta-lactamase class C and other penicillin binding protein [Vibrio nigripulchritudo BLFn1]|nr:putative Beta-lactamase class C and other penicillin binding protein [Vibrio nigripulchritudo BLFn1]
MRTPSSLTCLSCTLAAILTAALPLAANAQESSDTDQFLGLYTSKFDGLPHIKFYRDKGKHYLLTAWGNEPIAISLNGEFRSQLESTGTRGQFKKGANGEYRLASINYWGNELDLYRVKDATGEKLVEKLYQTPWIQPLNSKEECNDDWLEKDENPVYDREKLSALYKKFDDNAPLYQHTTSLLVMKDGKLVIEKYRNGWKRDYPHSIQSITKSLTSLATGVAIEEKKLKSIDQPIAELLPKYSEYLQGDKADITLKHMLKMGSGLQWDEWSIPYTNPNNPRSKEMASYDPLEFVLSHPLSEKPGTKFNYNGGNVTVVGEIIARQYDKEFLTEAISDSALSKLCFINGYISGQMGYVSNAAGGGYLRPRDMLKLGILVNDDGKWQGEQLVSKEWIKDSVHSHLKISADSRAYGYYWWLDEHFVDGKTYKAIYGIGHGGQMVGIVKELDLVVVKTATNYANRHDDIYLMQNAIIPIFKQ